MREQRTVIFVGGTSFSGSTLFDMMLANDPRGLSCGEVYAIFHPYRRHHLQLDSLGKSIDWRAIRKAGPNNVYAELFKRFPECRFIVDSSKSPLWISERTAHLRDLGVRTENVLIWKTPAEFRASRRKRGRERGWQREWVNYHRYYFTMVRQWHSVRYRNLVTDGAALNRVCEVVGIPHFAGKESYWLRPHHTVFGNDTTRIHLHDQATAEYASVKRAIASDIEEPEMPRHRTISYQPAEDGEIPEESAPGRIRRILCALERSDVSAGGAPDDRLAPDLSDLRVGHVYRAYQSAVLKYGLGWVVDSVRRAV